MSDAIPPSRQFERQKKISKATFSLITAVAAIIFLIMAYALGIILWKQAGDPAFNAGIMSAAEWERAFSNWIQLLSFFLLSGLAGGISSIIGIFVGILALREIKRSSGSLGGKIAARSGIALGAIGVIMEVLALCAVLSIFILAAANI